MKKTGDWPIFIFGPLLVPRLPCEQWPGTHYFFRSFMSICSTNSISVFLILLDVGHGWGRRILWMDRKLGKAARNIIIYIMVYTGYGKSKQRSLCVWTVLGLSVSVAATQRSFAFKYFTPSLVCAFPHSMVGVATRYRTANVFSD